MGRHVRYVKVDANDPVAVAKALAKNKLLYDGHASDRRGDGASRRTRPFSRAGKRLREVERTIRDRHGVVPDTDDDRLYLDLVANCYHVLTAGQDQPVAVDDVMARFWGWCRRWALHTTSDQALAIVRQELAGPPELIDDDVAGRAIRLAYADRMRLKITAIGSYDVNKAGRTKLAEDREREADRRRDEKRRRANGAKPHALSLSQTRPWEAEGITRRTWERRRKAAATSAGGDVANSSGDPSSLRDRSNLRQDGVGQDVAVPYHLPAVITAPLAVSGAPKATPRQAPIDDDVIVLKRIEHRVGVGFARATPPPLTHVQRVFREWGMIR